MRTEGQWWRVLQLEIAFRSRREDAVEVANSERHSPQYLMVSWEISMQQNRGRARWGRKLQEVTVEHGIVE